MEKNYQMYVNIVNHTIEGHQFKNKPYDHVKCKFFHNLEQKVKLK